MEAFITKLAYVHFFAFLGSFFMAVIVLRRPAALINRLASLLFLLISLWDLSMVFRHDPNALVRNVRLFLNLGSLGWIGMPAVFLCFVGVLTGNRILRGRGFLPFLVPALVLLGVQIIGGKIMDVSAVVRATYGWPIIYLPESFWINAYYVYLLSYIPAGLVLLALRYRAADSAREKKRLLLILWTGSFSFVTGSISDVFLPLFGILSHPGVADILTLVWIGGMYLGITKYGLLSVTPELAADRIIETMSHALFLTDTSDRIKFVNSAAAELTALPREALLGRFFNEAISFDEEEPSRADGSTQFEGRVRDETGDIPVLVTRSNMKDESGDSLGRVYIVKNIAEIRAFEEELKLMLRENIAAKEEIQKLLEEKDLLLHEVHHRNKNNMNVISSLLSLQAQTLTDPEAVRALNIARSRVRSMMIMYDKLYRSGGDFRSVSSSGYFSDLIDDIVTVNSETSRIKIEKKIEDISLESKVVFPVGIIINELISNALKYAFPQGREGRILVAFERSGEKGAVLTIEDDGVGLPEKAVKGESSGFGLNLVRSLVGQIGGNFDACRMAAGTRIRIDFPLA